MKKTTLEMQGSEEKRAGVGTTLMSTALIGALSLFSPSEGLAQTTSTTHEGEKIELISTQGTNVEEKRDTITLDEAVQRISSDGPRIQAHGFAQVGSNVAPEFAEVLSNKPSIMLCINASDKKTGLGLTVARLDDFHNDSEYPASKATVLNTQWKKTFGKDGNASIAVEGKYTFIDNLPSANGFTSDVVGSYTTKKGLTAELMYAHGFKKGKDMNAVRISVSQNIGSVLKATGKVWIKSDSNPKAYWQAGLEANKNGMGLQFGVIGKGKTRTPIISVRHTF